MVRIIRGIVVILAVLSLACAHGRAAPTTTAQAREQPDHSRIVFKVASAATDQMLQGVQVSIISQDGTETQLGQTDFVGQLSVPKATLREHRARFVLFSREHFFTGAIRADEFHLLEYDDFYIELAAFAIT